MGGGYTGKATFAALRDSTELLPEKLVGLLDELRFGGYLQYEENENGNPYGNLSLTAAGRELLDEAGQDVSLFMANTPRHYKVSAPERSTRRGGRRLAEAGEAP